MQLKAFCYRNLRAIKVYQHQLCWGSRCPLSISPSISAETSAVSPEPSAIAIAFFGLVLVAIIAYAGWSANETATETERTLVENALNQSIARALNEQKISRLVGRSHRQNH